MKTVLIDAKTELPIQADFAHQLLIDAYQAAWIDKFGKPPSGWHPLPDGVGSDAVEIFISFSEHQE
jgi:hypothetical protein